MSYYVIRHKKTQELMPQAVRNRGYSHWNPSNKKEFIGSLGVPRIIKSYGIARRIIIQWYTNPNLELSHQFNFEHGTDDNSLVTKNDGRSQDDLEIIEIEIKEIRNET